MHHMYPLSKGDQLCPLGFHPQVRWPTRCKRCFRDYKEHGGKRGSEDIAASSPSLTESSMKPPTRSWTSTQNLSSTSGDSNGSDIVVNYCVELRKRPSSWTSTPDLEDTNKDSKSTSTDVSVRVQLPARRSYTAAISETAETEESFTIRRPPLPPSSKESPDDWVILKTDSLAERVRKMNLKKQKSLEREGSREKSVPRKVEKEKSPAKEPDRERTKTSKAAQRKHEDAIKANQDVQFLIKVKEKSVPRQDDDHSMTTETTDTTLVDPNDPAIQNEVKVLRKELELMKARAERAEREKSDILLRRLASIDTGPNRTAASEALKLQQKVNEMKTQLEELTDDKRCLSIKVRELEKDLDSRPSKSIEDELRRKLQAAEQLCEELMDENEDIKKELKGMEQEIDEMHDSFREDQVEEFATICKKYEQTEKNCRVLSFKLKKSERKIEQLEKEKQTLISQNSNDLLSKIQRLEEDLKNANDLARRLQTEADQTKTPGKKKPPTLGVIGKSTSADGKVTRESLTRGGSQEDPAQLLRDLQDSIEREADLKEQLKFAESEAESLRKKSSRIEDENESLMMQLKKMATRARKPPVEHDEGISDDDDPAELRVLLELNEQEATILRQKVEDLESENNEFKKQIKDLQDKIKTNSKNESIPKRTSSILSKSSSTNEQKLKALEDEMAELRKTIAEKERSIEKLTAEITALKNKTSKPYAKTNSFDGTADQQKQLQMVEQEASVLRGKITNLEQENEKLALENKKLQMQSLRKNSVSSQDKNGANSAELAQIKDLLSKTEKERDTLNSKLEAITKEAIDKLPPRNAKRVTDLTPKSTMRKFIEELEEEVKDLRLVVAKSSGENVKKIESEKTSIQKELKEVREQLTTTQAELKKLKASKDSASTQAAKLSELELKFKKSDVENSKLSSQNKELEEKIKSKDTLLKQTDSVKVSLEAQIKKEKEKFTALEKNLEKEKKETTRWEARVAELDDELATLRKTTEKQKASFEKEIQDLKSKITSKSDALNTKKLQELRKQLDDRQSDLSKETKKYTELNARYEMLQEENVLTKAQLTAEKQNLQSDLALTKQKLTEIDSLKKEKAEIEKKLKEAQAKLQDLETKSINNKAKEYEKTMLKSTIAEREREMEKLKKENEMNVDLASQMRKDNEELRRKLDDFERVNKAQRSMSEYNSNLEREVKKLQTKLEGAELTAKSEVASTRLRYEQQVKNLQAEMSSMQRQCERFKKDRDTFKQLLESAQKTIGELKQNSGRQSRASLNSGDEDDKGKILALEQQLGCLEDQLSEARLEASRLKTEMVQERSANEIKISEMTSKLNEYEEDRLIGSGRTKIAGMKTKLELSWQKEREEQQRLLQETATLARDLRQTLFEVERERDKERIESKRKHEQLKRATEEELEEGRKKISELQCDLLELRDAHAKLRTSNEKLRRERERFEREIARRRMEHDGDRKVGVLLQTVDELVKIAPELQIAPKPAIKKPSATTPAPSANLKPESNRRSRSPSPGPNSIQISSVLARLAEASEELRRYQRLAEEDRERDRTRRGGMRRAASTENEPQPISRNPSSGKLSRSATHNGSLIRKSLSLDHSIQQDQSIWRQDDGSMSSMQSIDSELGGMVRDSSMDSRLSGGSTQSDLPRGPRKKKRGLMGKLRSLTKSSRTGSESSIQGSDSDVSTASADIRGSKKDLKGRLSGMFRRSNSATRSNSTEQIDSSQKPVAVTMLGSNSSTPAQSTPTTPKVVRAVGKPPTPTTPVVQRKTK